MAAGRDIEETDSLRIAGLFLAFIVITLLFEKLTHYLDTHLKGRTRRGLRHAVHHIEEELLALGLISLLLIVSEEFLLEICVTNDDATSEKKDGYSKSRKLLLSRSLLAGGDDDTCSKGKEPFWSAQTIHQTHIFIFLIAVIHVLYATVSILICLWRMHRWKRFEDQKDYRLKEIENARLISGRNTFEYWFWSFWAQFSPSVDESLYLSMRCLFIERMEFPEDFDFLAFVVNTLVEEFAIVVRTDWIMWVVAAVWILLPPFLLVTTAATVLIVLVAGTKLEVVGVKLTQLAYLAYHDRSSAQVQSITAPNTLIRKYCLFFMTAEQFYLSSSVMRVARKLNRFSGSSDASARPPHLATQSLSVYGRVDVTTGDGDAVRRTHSFEDRKRVKFASGEKGEEMPEVHQVHENAIDISRPVDEASGSSHRKLRGFLHWGSSKENKTLEKTFSEKYHLPDSAKLFWFKRPQLILKALRFVYFETAMAIAVVCFDLWHSSDFIIKDTDFFGHRFSVIAMLIGVGVLCLLQTSFFMLPTYALTMVAGSHCPETLLNIAKKMKVKPAQVMRIESLGEKSIQSQMNTLNQPLSFSEKLKNEDQDGKADTREKAISSLIGAMYKGRLQRLTSQSQKSARLMNESEVQPDVGSGTLDSSAELDRNGQHSRADASAEDEDMMGIVAVFGSFEGFLRSLHTAQESIRSILPTASFNFDCATASYDGLESTPFDQAAINLTWDLIAAQKNGLVTQALCVSAMQVGNVGCLLFRRLRTKAGFPIYSVGNPAVIVRGSYSVAASTSPTVAANPILANMPTRVNACVFVATLLLLNRAAAQSSTSHGSQRLGDVEPLPALVSLSSGSPLPRSGAVQEFVASHLKTLHSGLRRRQLTQLQCTDLTEFYEAETSVWNVTSAVYSACGLQAVIDQARDYDVIFVEPAEKPIVLERSLTVRKPLTISGPDGLKRYDATVSKAFKKIVMTCFSDNDAIFDIRASNVTLANIVIRDCALSGMLSPIMVQSEVASFRLHHAAFINNSNSNHSSTISFGVGATAEIRMVNVTFDGNRATGAPIMHLPQTTYMTNVTIVNNEGASTVLKAGAESQISITGLIADKNSMTVLNAMNSGISLTNSNLIHSGLADLARGSSLVLEKCEAKISNCAFIENKAREGGAIYAVESMLNVSNTIFEKNLAEEGGACLLEGGQIRMVDCQYLSNTASNDAGAIRSKFNNTLSCSGCVFQTNKAENFGGCLLIDGSTVTFQDSKFEDNKAIFGGVFRSEDSTVVCNGSAFRRNEADNTGGMSYLDETTFVFINSTIENNKAIYGGAIYAQNCDLSRFRNTTFENNVADLLGGAASIDFTHIVFENVHCSKNMADLGGAFSFYGTTLQASGLSLLANEASEGGGFVAKKSQITIQPRFDSFGAEFGVDAVGNIASNGGGAMDMKDTDAAIEGARFEKNRGTEGGAIHIWGSRNHSGSLGIMHASFSNNIAEETGGDISSRASEPGTVMLTIRNVSFSASVAEFGASCFLFSTRAVFENCSFKRCLAKTAGSVCVSKRIAEDPQSVPVSLIDCQIKNNTAETYGGGGLYATEGVRVVVAGSVIENNIARDGSGSGIYINNADLSLKKSVVKGNTAHSLGGGICARNGSVTISDSSLIRNTAQHGAGLHLENVVISRIRKTRFKSNKAKDVGGGISLVDSVVKGEQVIAESNAAQSGGGMHMTRARFLCLNCMFKNNTAKSEGGAIRVQSKEDNSALAQFERTSFVKNSAALGGAILLEAEDRHLHDEDGAAGLAIINSVFDRNEVEISGIAVHSNSKEHIHAHCRDTKVHQDRLEFVTRKELLDFKSDVDGEGRCESWGPLTDKKKKAVSTYASSARIEAEGLVNSEDGLAKYEFVDVVLGTQLPEIRVFLVDDYGQSRAAIMAGPFEVTLSGRVLEGVLTASKSKKESWEFAPFKTSNSKPDVYELIVSFPDYESLADITITIRARECLIGEAAKIDGAACQQCDNNTYSLNPEHSCSPCPKNANCTGSFVFPVKGYWQSDPCHNRTTRCLNPQACNGYTNVDYKGKRLQTAETREEALYYFTVDGLDRVCPGRESDEQKMYRTLQCSEGYEGVLCGACSAGKGSTSNFGCADCNGEGLLVVLLLLAAGWIVVVVLITIRGNTVHSRRLVRRVIGVRSFKRFDSRRSDASRQSGTTIRVGNREQLESVAGCSSDAGATNAQQNEREETDIEKEKRVQLAKWRLCEIVKVTINCLQAVAIAVVINVDWQELMRSMFRASDIASGATVETVSNAIYCLSARWRVLRPSAASVVVVLFGPFLIALGFFIRYGIKSLREGSSVNKFVKSSLLSFFAIVYFNYMNITKQSVTVFRCVGVKINDAMDRETSTLYWAQDTSVECYDYAHNKLIILAVVFLAIFSIGFPAFCGITLHRCHQRGRLNATGALYDVMGFLYRGYRSEFCWWESMIMFRKAGLSLVAVFAHTLAGTTQGIMASFLLVMCLFSHTICQPYRKEFQSINTYESLSLLVSCTIYLLSPFFGNDGAADWVRYALSAYLLSITAGFVLWMVIALFLNFIEFVKADMELAEFPCSDESMLDAIRLWILYRMGRLETDVDLNAELELKSLP